MSNIKFTNHISNLLNMNAENETARIILFLRKTLKKTGLKHVVIGWSGGIDSTVSLYLLSKAIPEKNIHVLHLPHSTTYIDELSDLNISIPSQNTHEISIRNGVDDVWRTIKSIDSHNDKQTNLEQVRLGNIMARIRMIVLFDYAKRINGLVCGTENRSEYLLGYFTRYGDEASDIEPIQHLYKTQVYQLARYLKIPKRIIDRQPTANLWKGQTDERDFGFTYKEADEVLSLYVDKKIPLKDIEKKGYTQTKKIIERLIDNAFKHKVPYKIFSI